MQKHRLLQFCTGKSSSTASHSLDEDSSFLGLWVLLERQFCSFCFCFCFYSPCPVSTGTLWTQKLVVKYGSYMSSCWWNDLYKSLQQLTRCGFQFKFRRTTWDTSDRMVCGSYYISLFFHSNRGPSSRLSTLDGQKNLGTRLAHKTADWCGDQTIMRPYWAVAPVTLTTNLPNLTLRCDPMTTLVYAHTWFKHGSYASCSHIYLFCMTYSWSGSPSVSVACVCDVA